MIWSADFRSQQGGEKSGRETGCGQKTAGISEKKKTYHSQKPAPGFCEKSAGERGGCWEQYPGLATTATRAHTPGPLAAQASEDAGTGRTWQGDRERPGQQERAAPVGGTQRPHPLQQPCCLLSPAPPRAEHRSRSHEHVGPGPILGLSSHICKQGRSVQLCQARSEPSL